MRRQVLPALRMLAVMTLLAGVLYTGVVTVFSQTFLEYRADGSLIIEDGHVVGSELLGQWFNDPSYFHPRPSAVDYDPGLSGATNFGPNHPEHLDAVAGRVEDYRRINGLAPEILIPVDAVTASASGLDPHISLANARLQAPRVAGERGMSVEQVMSLIDANRASVSLSYLADPSVNVLRLNLTLDEG